MDTVKINLKEIRKNKGFSQERLSRALNTSATHLRDIENNRSKLVSLDMLSKLCNVLECEPGDLLKLERN